MDIPRIAPNIDIPEDTARLERMACGGYKVNIDAAAEFLRNDSVVLLRDVSPAQADSIMLAVATKFRLSDSLQIQAGFAGFLGHRHNIGQYFMSVNKRGDYQFISPHSEGDSFTNMQIASFYCFENSTDGGETILMNVDAASKEWQIVREKVTKVRPKSRVLTGPEAARAKAIYHLHSLTESLTNDDIVLLDRRSDIPGLLLVDVLTKPQSTFSCILDREVNTYWDSIASIDHDSKIAFAALLSQSGLLREPQGGLDLSAMDNAGPQRLWHSGLDYNNLFKCKISLKLGPGDFLLQNNLTWTHAVTNWNPNSGIRRVAASFA